MVTRAPTCAFIRPGGLRCQAPRLRDGEFCFWHDPDHAEEVQEARRLGGFRRKKERTVAGAYDFAGVRTIEDLRRLLEIAVVDALALENTVARARAIAYLVQTALKLQQVGELEERLATLEATVGASRVAQVKPLFERGLEDDEDEFGEAFS